MPPNDLNDYDDLTLDPNNANDGTERGRGLLETSFRTVGAGRSAVATADGGVAVGNKSIEIAHELGLPLRFVHTTGQEFVVVIRDDLPSLDHPLARELATADNAVAAASLSWNPLQLAHAQNIVPEIDKYFDQAEWAELLKEVTKDAPIPGAGGDEFDEDAAEEQIAAPITQPGDLWRLGPHFLFCGDSTQEATITLLKPLAGGSHACVWTDPPYAIYGSSTGVSSDVCDDSMVRPFFEAVFNRIRQILPLFGHAYVSCDWRSWAAIWESAKRARLTCHNKIIWDKGGAGLGSHYANAYEEIGFFAKLPAESAVGERQAGQRLVMGKSNIMRHLRVLGKERLHNAAKPVDLIGDCIMNSTDPGDVVWDLFGGSGSTLIACHRQARRAILIEKEPKWCDVILTRWEAESTGLAPVLMDAAK